jgi:phosphinothricin acetyltransferase
MRICGGVGSGAGTLQTLQIVRLDPPSDSAQRAITLVAEHGRWEHDRQHYFDGEVEPCINGRTIETRPARAALVELADLTAHPTAPPPPARGLRVGGERKRRWETWLVVEIRDADLGDVQVLTDLANQYIDTRTMEWTERRHTVESRTAWLHDRIAGGWPVLVAEVDGAVVGMAAYGDFRDSTVREGYRFVVENSVHVFEAMHGRGVGRALMETLIERARRAGKHVMVAAIDHETPESVAFHQRLGFVEVGRLPEIGFKFGRRLDLILMQRMLA